MTLTLSADHLSLRDLEGRWSGRGDLLPSPWTEATTFESDWTFSFDRAGRNLIHDYRERRSTGETFDGHGVMTLDPETQEILWFWFDGHGYPPLSPARGRWVDGVLVLRKTTPRGSNITTFAPSGDQLTYRIETRQPSDEAFRPLLRGVCQRAAAP